MITISSISLDLLSTRVDVCHLTSIYCNFRCGKMKGTTILSTYILEIATIETHTCSVNGVKLQDSHFCSQIVCFIELKTDFVLF